MLSSVTENELKNLILSLGFVKCKYNSYERNYGDVIHCVLFDYNIRWVIVDRNDDTMKYEDTMISYDDFNIFINELYKNEIRLLKIKKIRDVNS